MNILKQKKLLLTAMLLATVFFSVPVYSYARGSFIPCGGYNADGTREAPCNVCDMFSVVALATNWLISVAGIYAVFEILFAGFKLIWSMGEEERITKNKSALTNAVVGLVLVMIAFILVNTTINVILLEGGKAGSTVNLSDPFKYLNSAPNLCHT
jgi:Type IV secretion system pilin